MSTRAVDELLDLSNGGRERREARQAAVIELSSLMTGTPVKRRDVPAARPEEPIDEDEKNREIVRAALELNERDPKLFKALVLELRDGEPAEAGIPLSNKDRTAGVMTLASMVNHEMGR